MGRITLIGLSLLTAGVLLGGCGSGTPTSPPSADGPRRPTPLLPTDMIPTTNVKKVVLLGEPRPTDSDGDGRLDMMNIDCYLFPSSQPGPISVFGRGTFRFEIYRAGDPVEGRPPISQVNINYEDSLRNRAVKTMPMYAFRLPLGPLPRDVTQIYIRGRFFPEDGDEAEAGGTRAAVPSFGGGVAPSTTVPPRTGSATDAAQPETRIIRIVPRQPQTQPDEK
jgi:hypothetical protein